MATAISGTTGITFTDATTLNSAGSALRSNYGYVKLPDGTIIQYGQYNQTSGGNITVTFPLTFPNAIQSITFGQRYTGALSLNSAVLNAPGLSSMTVTTSNAGGTFYVYWMAIGY